MTRVRFPDDEGFVERDGVRVFWERYGEGDTTILLLPAWSVCYSRLWKGQIPYLARHFRVLAFDPRGNGRSDKPAEPAAYADHEIVEDALAVMDATATERAIVVGASLGGWLGAILVAMHPDRIDGAFLMCPASQLGDPLPERSGIEFTEKVETDEGWRGKFNRHYWLRDFDGFADFFAAKCITERHSTKQIEDMAGWIRETTPESLIASAMAPGFAGLGKGKGARELYERIERPVIVVHGDGDAVIAYAKGVAVAEAIGAPLVTLEGSGHVLGGRIPVKINLMIREFVESVRDGTAPLPRREAARIT